MKPATDAMKPADAPKAADTPVTTDPAKAAADAGKANMVNEATKDAKK